MDAEDDMTDMTDVDDDDKDNKHKDFDRDKDNTRKDFDTTRAIRNASLINANTLMTTRTLKRFARDVTHS